jgi:hypothetical protein
MTAETHIVIHGVCVDVTWTRRARGYSAELRFADGDRAALDAASLHELEHLVVLAASAAVLARQVGQRWPRAATG